MTPHSLIKYLIYGEYRGCEGVLAVLVFKQESWLDAEYKGRFAGSSELILVEEPAEDRRWISLGGTNMKEAWQVVGRAIDSGFKSKLITCTSDEQLVEYLI